ncbi:MAG: stage V sporulation protein AD [Firmicutes bacterium]|nr:stage V sporulation protein AD [Bacillota bacterium]
MTSVTILKGENTTFLPKNLQSVSEAETVQSPEKLAPAKAKQTVFFRNPPRICAGAAVVTQREADGPVGEYFSSVVDSKMGEKNFETAEIRMLKEAVTSAAAKAGLWPRELDLLLAGDLLNQITSSSYVARDLGIPYMGLYSACATMTQALALAAALLDAGCFTNIACATASHFSTAERQYRYPLEYGAQRPPYAQWTVTGAGCSIVSSSAEHGPRITAATFGKAVDFGVNDISNMGAAMAPAAMDTLYTMLRETGLSPSDFDLILTGDLGKLGSDILRDLMREQGIELGQNYSDCGTLIYDNTQKVYQGGSGAGCSASVFNSYILDRFLKDCYSRIAFLATGALMNPQSTYQGETIPCISHAVIIEK